VFSSVKNWPAYFVFKTGISGGKSFTFQLQKDVTIQVPRQTLGPFRECFFDGQYLKNIDRKSFPKNPLILDIGANVGYAALHFFYEYPAATIHSFEPMPFCIQRIETEQKNFPQYNWTLHKYGVWKAAGELELFTNSEEGFSTTSGIVKHNDQQQKTVIKVDTLANFFARNSIAKVDLFKIDCEGAEYEIMFNLPGEVLQKIERIAMETHPGEQWNTADMVEFLLSKGFKVQAEGDYVWASR
jgi:FkbM family methyltransferase